MNKKGVFGIVLFLISIIIGVSFIAVGTYQMYSDTEWKSLVEWSEEENLNKDNIEENFKGSFIPLCPQLLPTTTIKEILNSQEDFNYGTHYKNGDFADKMIKTDEPTIVNSLLMCDFEGDYSSGGISINCGRDKPEVLNPDEEYGMTLEYLRNGTGGRLIEEDIGLGRKSFLFTLTSKGLYNLIGDSSVQEEMKSVSEDKGLLEKAFSYIFSFDDEMNEFYNSGFDFEMGKSIVFLDDSSGCMVQVTYMDINSMLGMASEENEKEILIEIGNEVAKNINLIGLKKI